MSTTQKTVISFVVGVVVGGGYMQFTMGQPLSALPDSFKNIWLLGAVKGGTPSTANANAENVATPAVEVTIATSPAASPITVSDQAASSVVFLSGLTLAQSTWVAIHEDAEGEPGRILGAARYDAGVSSGNVELLRPTVRGGLYYAVLYVDDGDRQFDSKKDVQVKDETGKTVMASFKAN